MLVLVSEAVQWVMANYTPLPLDPLTGPNRIICLISMLLMLLFADFQL